MYPSIEAFFISIPNDVEITTDQDWFGINITESR